MWVDFQREKEMRILVCGGREYSNRAKVYEVLSFFKEVKPIIIHGAEIGADSLADEAAKYFGFETDPTPADWAKYGKAAGPVRNKVMLDKNPDLVIAFPGGPGTANMKMIAKNAGTTIFEVI